MKKHNKVLLMILSFVLMLSFSFAVMAENETTTDSDWKYELLEDGTAKITKYTGKDADVTVPSEIGDITVTALGKELFRGVEKAEKVTVPDSVVTMENTFYMAENVKEIYIGKGLEELTGNVFYCAWNLENITISEDNKALTSMDGVLFNKDMTEIISYPCGKPENTYTIPDTVETLGEKSFMGAKNLVTVYMPESVKFIGPFAFAYCSALTDVYYAGSKAQFEKIGIDEETVFFNNVIYVGDHVHSFDNASVVKKATNKANGKVKYTCSCGESKSETVYKISSVKLSTTKYTYNGKQKSPSVEVKDSKGKTLKKGTDYTVKYASGRKNPGRYKVTVTFKGKYEYKKELSFVIAPKTPTLKVSASKTKVTLSYTELAGVTGYQIYYSTDGKTYKKLTALKSEKYTKTLKSGQKYYFKVRGYVKVADGDVIYGAFSSVKSIKIK